MTGRPTIALLVPAYNAAHHLPRLLTSAARQEEPFDAIWVYDDCSTDATAAVAEAHGARALRGETNKGCSAGKNVLAAHADADYLHFHDQDDALLPNFVRLARRWIAAGPPDIVLFAYEYRDDDTGALLATRSFDHEALSRDPRSYAIREQINPFCGLYRRSAYLAAGGYDEDPAVLYNEDAAFHIRMAFAGLTFGAEPEVSIVNYRRRGSMSASNRVECLRAQLAVLKKTLRRLDAATCHDVIAARLWRSAALFGACSDWEAADEAVRLAASLAPPSPSAGGSLFQMVARLSPAAALRAREAAIRVLRPALRP